MSPASRLARVVAVVAVLALLAGACQPEDVEEALDDAEQGLRDLTEGEPAPGEDPGGDTASGAGEANGGGDADAGADEPAVQVPDDRGRVGAACRPYLRSDIPALAIEVVHQRGAELQPGAMDHLVGAVGDVVDKPAGVELVGPTPVPGDGRTWTADELRSFAAEHRTRRSSAEETAMLVLAVRGEFEQQGVLGVAISATEFAVFPDNLDDLTLDLLGGREPIERAVLVHEAGHLLCLVGITYDSARDHEDPEHPNHSVHEDSVMHWAIETDAITQVFSGAPPADFHPDDRHDLEALREGRD